MKIEPNGLIWWLLSAGGSNDSVKDTIVHKQKNFSELEAGLDRDDLRDVFYYESKEPHTEIVIEHFGEADSPYATITRNRYGALVLNAQNVFFADVDLKLPMQWTRHSNPTYWDNFHDDLAEADEIILARFASFSKQNPSLSFRTYETAAGYRLIMTSETVEATSEKSSNWLKALESDKLYSLLCERQKCYRARLTPKPWRLPNLKSPMFYPDATEGYELNNWLDQYEMEASSFAICRNIKSYGDGTVTDETEKVVQLHDHYVLSDSSSALA